MVSFSLGHPQFHIYDGAVDTTALKPLFYSATSRCLPGAAATGPPCFGRGVRSPTAAGTERGLHWARQMSPRAVGVLIRLLTVHQEDSLAFPFLT